MKSLIYSFILSLLLSTFVFAGPVCPSKSVVLRFVATNEITGEMSIAGVEIDKNFLPGTEVSCPDKDVIIKILRTNSLTGDKVILPLLITKGALNEPENVLTSEEETLFKEKGIVNPPKQVTPKPETKPAPLVPKKGSLTANAEAGALHSSMD